MTKRVLQERRDKLNLAYGLDIWRAGVGKVMNLQWEQSDTRVELVGFRGGKWESELLSIVAGIDPGKWSVASHHCATRH